MAGVSQTIVNLTHALAAAAHHALVPADLLGQARQQPIITAGPAFLNQRDAYVAIVHFREAPSGAKQALF